MENQKKPLTINITKTAAEHVREFATSSGKPDSSMRDSALYFLDLVETFLPDDKIIEVHGLKLGVDKKSYVFLAGTTLDYSGGLNGKGFVFNNPNAKTACGCGTSFGV